MEQYIPKAALVTHLATLLDKKKYNDEYEVAFRDGNNSAIYAISHFLNTLEVKEVGTDIPNIDNLLEEDGIDPDSREAKIFKESYYSALEKLKEKIV